MFIQTETTPNPATLKFLPGKTVLPDGTREFTTAEDASVSPLARAIFEVEGVTAVFFGGEFISVTRTGDNWEQVKPSILGAIMDHYTSGAPILNDGAAEAPDAHATYEGEDGEIVEQIKELLDTRIRPAVAQDGGDITFHSFEDGILFLHMRGACAGCPASTMTLKAGIENMMRHYVPEVEEVRQIL